MNVAPLSPRSTDAAEAPWWTPAERPSPLHAVVLFVLVLLMTVPGIFTMPPIDRDEARYVQATKQMAESGDYVDIRFQEATRYKKPIGIYWMQSAVVAVTGYGAEAPIWTYRLVSVLGITVAVLSLYWTGAHLFGRNAGLVAGLVMAALFASAFEGRVAKTDAMVVGLCVLAQGMLARIYLAVRAGRDPEARLPWIFWAAQGVAILVKGPIAPLLAATTIVTLVAYDREWRWLKQLKAGRGLLVVLAIVLPWLLFITWKSGGAFWQESVGKDLLAKVGDGQESHGAPPGYYLLTYSLFFWPFGLYALSAWGRANDRLRSDPRLAFCLAWYIPFWLLFELIPTKLPHYVMPAYPGLALLAGWLATLPAAETARPLKAMQLWSLRAAAFGHIVVTIGLAVVVLGLSIYLLRSVSLWSVPAAALVLLTGWLAWPRAGQLSLSQIAAAALSAAGAYALIFGLVFPAQSPLWLSPRIAEAVAAQRPCPDSVLASVRFHEPSLVFLAGTDTKLTDATGAAAHLAANPACALALVPANDEPDFRAAILAGGMDVAQLDRIEGLNYSTGDALSLGLFRIAPNAPAAP